MGVFWWINFHSAALTYNRYEVRNHPKGMWLIYYKAAFGGSHAAHQPRTRSGSLEFPKTNRKKVLVLFLFCRCQSVDLSFFFYTFYVLQLRVSQLIWSSVATRYRKFAFQHCEGQANPVYVRFSSSITITPSHKFLSRFQMYGTFSRGNRRLLKWLHWL